MTTVAVNQKGEQVEAANDLIYQQGEKTKR